jgi:hypothetical protein
MRRFCGPSSSGRRLKSGFGEVDEAEPGPDLGNDLLGVPIPQLGLTDEAASIEDSVNVLRRLAENPCEFSKSKFRLVAADHTTEIENRAAHVHELE